MTRTAFLFPGQGGYLPGALAESRDSHPEVAEVVAELDAVARSFGRAEISSVLCDPDAPGADVLAESDPETLHLALYGIAVASFRLLVASGLRPDVLIGHSFGEIAALAAAGVFTVEQGAVLVAHRDEALRRHGGVAGGLVVLGTGYRRARHLLGAVDSWELAVAVDNSPDQVVVSGPDAELGALVSAAEALGISVTRLPVGYAFHNSRLLAAAAEDFAERASSMLKRRPRIPVYSPILSRYLDGPGDVDALIADQLVRPVRFLDAVRTVHADGVRSFVECGPRSTCRDLVDRIVPHVNTAVVPRGSVEEEAAPPVPEPARRRPEDEASVLEKAREIYATALGYPHEVLLPDADLEGDLGVDSVKQTELVMRVLKTYDLAVDGEAPRPAGYPTLRSVAQLVGDLAARREVA
ncbi:acyltransferase domain-containing protein [Actinosynnema sp. NPDC050436]|uniref:acyltransferase domain-containing protein n=1 Tax=Actinosynnema sp. NPDC050436 TaxID=3155659 RepID=UPI00340ECD25